MRRNTRTTSSPTARLAVVLAAVAALLAGPLGLASASAQVAPAPVEPGPAVPAVVQVIGRGWGHGRGLGQYGSLGYALERGWDHARILDHFYGGTTMATRPDEAIRVRLVGFDDLPVVVVRPAGGVRVDAGGLAAQEWPAVQAVPDPTGGTWTLAGGADCAGSTGWTPLGTVAGPVAFQAPGGAGGADPGSLLSACLPDGRLRAYRGTLHALRGTDGEARVVNETTLEQYLRGVVPRESPASWGDLGGGAGLAQLRAQSVAARSYALSEARYSYASTCDTTSCQVYGGVAVGAPGAWQVLEDPRTDRAIAETAGQVRVRDGQVMRTEFSSSTGGWTAGGTFPPVVDEGDAITLNPNATWSANVATTAIEAAYPQIGRFRTITVTRRNSLGELGGRATTVVVQGAQGQVSVTGAAFRSSFGLKSDWFRVATGFLSGTAVAVAQGPGDGYWVAGEDGSVLNVGGAGWYGSLDDHRLAQRIVSMAPTGDGRGYWLLGRDGGVFSFGAAAFFGSTGDVRLNRPVVGMAARRDSQGYWFVATDGGIFSFGSAGFFGSTGSTPLNRPIIAMAATASGNGYWLIASDGGVFTFGDAAFHGSTGATPLNAPIVGMAVRPQGDGYWFVAADGGVFTFGAASFHGSLGARAPGGAPIVGMSVTPSGRGYRLVLADGTTYGFGDAS